MRLSRHLVLSGVAGGAAWGITGEPWTFPIVLATGVLVDLDHGPDLWWTVAMRRDPVASYIGHAWEWLAGLTVLALLTGFSWWLNAIILGLGLHLITDQIFNSGGPWRYFFIYRARHRFRTSRMGPEWDLHATFEVLQQDLPVAARIIAWWRDKRRSN